VRSSATEHGCVQPLLDLAPLLPLPPLQLLRLARPLLVHCLLVHLQLALVRLCQRAG
jgi:hypothetical protein